MNKHTIIAALLLAALGPYAMAEGKPALKQQSASLQCADRKIELKGACYKEEGIRGLSCTSQSLVISDASGKKLGGKQFKPAPLQQGDSYPIVAEKVEKTVCAETPAKEKYIVAKMYNGGNCAQCEWAEVYAWDGSLAGSSRDPKRPAAVRDALKAAFDKKAKQVGLADLSSIYAETQ